MRPDEDTDALAAELALRVLSPADEADAQARAKRDPEFRAHVDAWNARLAALADELEPVEPSPGVWPRVEAGLPAPAAANDNHRVVFWRRWALASTGLLAASLAAVAVLASRPEPATSPASGEAIAVTRVATLTLQGADAPAMTIAYDSATGSLYLSPTDKMAGDPRVPHLWLLLPDGTPQLVGPINGVEVSTHSLKGTPLSELAASRAASVAVSMEQPGHTPGANRPDGPVVAAGDLQSI